MSSSIATQNANSTASAAPIHNGNSTHNSHLGATRPPAGTGSSLLPHTFPSQFREIHKNTWLKRLTADGKKITVGAKKSERIWVVFCVHDDTIALLEGYSEPRQTGGHIPEWVISLQDTLHISHALIPNSHEFEFVITLTNEVIRFHAMSWDIMQEWVTTLRSKLREMKILSPKENLYTKLPEVRVPLLPTRDPTSPLPAPPPVPAAIVPGVERVIPHSIQAHTTQEQPSSSTSRANATSSSQASNTSVGATATCNTTNSINENTNTSATSNNQSIAKEAACYSSSSATIQQPMPSFSSSTPNIASMSNTLSQNLLNMLSDPITAYSEQLNESSNQIDNDNDADDSESEDLNLSDDEFLSPILRKSCAQLLQSNETPSKSNETYLQRASADHVRNLENLLQCEPLIPRPQTSRSQSVGSADKTTKTKKLKASFSSGENERKAPSTSTRPTTTSASTSTSSTSASAIAATTSSSSKSSVCGIMATNNHITDIEISDSTETPGPALEVTSGSSSNNSTLSTGGGESEKNVTIIQVSTHNEKTDNKDKATAMPPPKLPTKATTTTSTASGDIFKFPEANLQAASSSTKLQKTDYKSNVQIIPSNLSTKNAGSTIQVISQDVDHLQSIASKSNDYSTPLKSSIAIAASTPKRNLSPAHDTAAVSVTQAKTSNSKGKPEQNNKVTTINVTTANDINHSVVNDAATTSVSIYGRCYTPAVSNNSPKLPKKIILSANTSGITNISVNNNPEQSKVKCDNEANVRHNVGNIHYEKVFLSSSIPILEVENQKPPLSSSINAQNHHNDHAGGQTLSGENHVKGKAKNPISPIQKEFRNMMSSAATSPSRANPSHSVSPALRRRHLLSPNARSPPTMAGNMQAANLLQHQAPRRLPLLTRGLTEAAIITRPSRKDLHNLKLATKTSKTNLGQVSNNNEEPAGSTAGVAGSSSTANHSLLIHPILNRTNLELLEQRRRSSSTSDAPPQQRQHTKLSSSNHLSNSNNNDVTAVGAVLRIQQPPMPFRTNENGISNTKSANASTNNSPVKRLTIREQQVMQIRREIMHPGGVRLQLRRKDCIGSIAWVEAFGAVWVAGWKQKDHPVLYNALHIGDQLLSIAGVSISSPVEANKVIRNTNTLFVEVLVRRIPFGRAYAIRREREGQCLGLIRDGNTATIVDVVPNSLAARHGLPPKAQSCDGSSLTFWVLTEINGRPLNLFFKDNEIRDRLNSVGRDISILVQPADLITKLRKQLKSLRSHKDYLVQ